jgi:hypothetical protein
MGGGWGAAPEVRQPPKGPDNHHLRRASMKITVVGISPHPKGLLCGLRVEHERAGWIRFATTVLVVDEMDKESRQAIVALLNRAAESDSRWEDVDLF